MGLVSKEVSLAGKVNVAAETGAGVCSVGGTLNPMKGSLETLYLFLQGRGVGGAVC